MGGAKKLFEIRSPFVILRKLAKFGEIRRWFVIEKCENQVPEDDEI